MDAMAINPHRLAVMLQLMSSKGVKRLTTNKMKTFEEYLKDITPNDFKSEDLKFIAEVMGVEMCLEIVKHLAGFPLNIPKNALDNFKNKYILEYYNGKNSRQLALETGFTKIHVCRMVRGGNENQLSLLDAPELAEEDE